mmetsp:Transcript_38532/g.49119  ORF Transcript_38532/g.49119 Transcript_38532/m.49119 type:complete len:400 (+) Transcript_38532:94-1293(+)|eukprot:CAMPEP_0117754518 /NCGR_PEP_ID=MMETSP0947-20121206/12876_1 /TAXON_ID=44440 /ORGANISM="Chattonella subsalsa, Strain CCMP2191" /LENGTH=399 /DNA_ID=CAMNT_0005573621 /DNA_START=1 /DNA_END=1200 /DNA_ORIENTATION=+
MKTLCRLALPAKSLIRKIAINGTALKARASFSTLPLQVADEPLKAVILREKKMIRNLILNRPEQINCLNLKTAKMINRALEMWHENEIIAGIVIHGEGEVFCGGADLHRLAKVPQKALDLRMQIQKIVKNLSKYNREDKSQIISLMNGTVLGGGYALGQGQFRVVTENTLFHIPEIFYGQALDGGLSYTLSRATTSEQLGLFVGLSGLPLDGVDMIDAGLATHFIHADVVEIVDETLADITEQTYGTDPIWNHMDVIRLDTNDEDVRKEIRGETEEPSTMSIFNELSPCFKDVNSVEEIVDNLKTTHSPHAERVLQNIMAASPLSLKVVFSQITQGRKHTLEQCLLQETYANMNLQKQPEFNEAVDAINKGGAIKWSSKLEDVSDEQVKDLLKVEERQV